MYTGHHALEWVLLILFKIKYTHGTTFCVVLDQDIDWVFKVTHLPQNSKYPYFLVLYSLKYTHYNPKKEGFLVVNRAQCHNQSLAAIVYRGLFHTLHPRKKQQTDLPSLLYCIPAV